MKSPDTGSRGKLIGTLRCQELMIDSPEMLMMISLLRSHPRLEEEGIDKLDIDSRRFEVNLD
jgi:hypothetical protein